MPRQVPNIVKTEYFHTPELNGIEAASDAYLQGAPLVNSSGSIAEASANPRDILGFAAYKASGVTGATVIFVAAIPGVTLEMSLDKASGLGTHALAQADVWAVYGITRDSGGIWYIDIDKVTAGTNTAVIVTALVDPIGAKAGDTPTDKNSGGGRVRCMLLGEASAFQTAAS